MCSYQGYEFGAGRYPDSVCIDGRLYDADNCDGDGNLYEPMEEIPCPICSREKAIAYWTEQNEGIGNEDDSEEESQRKAYECAVCLVDDIRLNRGLAIPADSSHPRAGADPGVAP